MTRAGAYGPAVTAVLAAEPADGDQTGAVTLVDGSGPVARDQSCAVMALAPTGRPA